MMPESLHYFKVNADNHSVKRVAGIWDISLSPVTLGRVLLFAHQLQMKKVIHAATCIDLCLIDKLNAKTNSNELLAVLSSLEEIDEIHFMTSQAQFQAHLEQLADSFVVWPPVNNIPLTAHQYGSTLYAQEFYRSLGYIPYLSFEKDTLIWARDFLNRNVSPGLPVVIHLKNNRSLKGQSNANFKVWKEFFLACEACQDIKFILIGNEPVEEELEKLPNVLLARKYGSDLKRDLALISKSFVFMGMSSGPGNMAIISDVPYLIFKNPDHDVEEMRTELGTADHFSFATPFQKFLRLFETKEILLAEFTAIYTRLNRADWEARLVKTL